MKSSLLAVDPGGKLGALWHTYETAIKTEKKHYKI